MENSKNMYFNVDDTRNFIKGICPHACAYCYMNSINKRFGKIPKPVFLDEKLFKANLGNGKTIFVGSSCDMWAESIPDEWIYAVLEHCDRYPFNKYLFQSKNPRKFFVFKDFFPKKCCVGTTVETDKNYMCMGNTPPPADRTAAIGALYPLERFITIEPVLDFNISNFISILKNANPDYVYIGADSHNNRLPEPPKEKIIELISELKKFTNVCQKENLRRLVA